MAHHRLGNAALARADFGRAVHWLGDHQKLDERWLADLKLFRAEAEALLSGPPGELPAHVFAID
jgi:hypothetical protein